MTTIYILTKKEEKWYDLRCYEKYGNRYEIVWLSYSSSKDAVIYDITRNTSLKSGVYLKIANGVYEVSSENLIEKDLQKGECVIAFFEGLEEL